MLEIPSNWLLAKKEKSEKTNKSIVRCWHIQQGFHGNCTQVILFEPSKNIWTRISELLNKRPVLGWLEVFFVVYMLYLKLKKNSFYGWFVLRKLGGGVIPWALQGNHWKNAAAWFHKKNSTVSTLFLVGGFKYFLFSPLLGAMIQFDWYFSKGLKPQTSFGFSLKNTPLKFNMVHLKMAPWNLGEPGFGNHHFQVLRWTLGVYV